MATNMADICSQAVIETSDQNGNMALLQGMSQVEPDAGSVRPFCQGETAAEAGRIAQGAGH